jgi:N-carbamoyl-L-amino-acid hydrolase
MTSAQNLGAIAPSCHPPEPDIALAARLLAELRMRTGGPRGINRTSYGLGEQIAHDMVRREARRLGFECAIDAGCNLYMTLRGQRRGPTILIGSHLDSVPMGGNYDGAAGVLTGLAVAAGYRAAGIVPPQDVTIMAIRAEESTWFEASYIGSRAAFGQLSRAEIDGLKRTGDGVALGLAIDASGGDSAALRQGQAALAPAGIAAFIEPHIEQGPVLAEQGRALGIVTGIRGSFRHRRATCHGSYAHSGATPREHRQDAVLAVARLITRLDDSWSKLVAQGHDLTVTFGKVTTDPDEAAFSKVAGQVDFALDIRSQDTETLELMRTELAAVVASLEVKLGVRFNLGPETGSTPARMDKHIVAALHDIAARQGVAPEVLACGAGHDAAVFAAMGIPTGMILIRNRNGSHNPDEAMEIEDLAAAARVLSAFCLRDLS